MKFRSLSSNNYKSRIDRLLDEGLEGKIITGYNSGDRVVSMAKEYGISVDVVYRILHKNGIMPYHHDNSRDVKLTEKKAAILALHRQGLKPKDIMKRLNMKNPKLIYETIKENGND